jgi:hypothetical protein
MLPIEAVSKDSTQKKQNQTITENRMYPIPFGPQKRFAQYVVCNRFGTAEGKRNGRLRLS